MTQPYIALTRPEETLGPTATGPNLAGWLVLAGDAEVTVAMDTTSVTALSEGRYGAWLRLIPVVPTEPDLALPRRCEEEMVIFDVAGRRVGSEAAAAWQLQLMARRETQWREKVLSEGARYLKDWRNE